MSLSISKARTNKNSTVSASRSHETLLTIIKQSSRTNKISFILSYCVQYINTGIHCDKNYNLIIPSFPTKQKKNIERADSCRLFPTIIDHRKRSLLRQGYIGDTDAPITRIYTLSTASKGIPRSCFRRQCFMQRALERGHDLLLLCSLFNPRLLLWSWREIHKRKVFAVKENWNTRLQSCHWEAYRDRLHCNLFSHIIIVEDDDFKAIIHLGGGGG